MTVADHDVVQGAADHVFAERIRVSRGRVDSSYKSGELEPCEPRFCWKE